ncbi:MAG: hypothetical protein ACRC8Y_09145 [Chroococcales cyanobacterium]
MIGERGGDGEDRENVCSNDFSRCQECHGGRHDTYHERLKHLFEDWIDRLFKERVTWLRPSNAVTTEVVTTNNLPHPPINQGQMTNDQ